MSINAYLSQVSNNLVLSGNEKASIKASIHILKTRLNFFLGRSITDHFEFGSSTRGTILPSKIDSKSAIDYMVVFDTSHGKEKPQVYTDQLRRFVSSEYSTSEILQSSPIIVLSLNNTNFNLVPAVDDLSTYEIPSPKSYWTDWMNTDPKSANKIFQDKNKSNHSNIKSLARLAKYWNAINNHPYIPFSLENHIVDKYFLCCTSLKDYFYAFWDDMSYNSDASSHIKDIIDSAKKHINLARAYERDNMTKSAEKEIKKIIPEL